MTTTATKTYLVDVIERLSPITRSKPRTPHRRRELAGR